MYMLRELNWGCITLGNKSALKSDQLSQVAQNLGIPYYKVEEIIDEYTCYLGEKLRSGESVRVLNICYLNAGVSKRVPKETTAYISYEIGKRVGMSSNVVYRVLSTYEEFVIRNLRKTYDCRIRGLVRITLEPFYSKKVDKTVMKVRMKKSTIYNAKDIRVSALSSFKRKLEVEA